MTRKKALLLCLMCVPAYGGFCLDIYATLDMSYAINNAAGIADGTEYDDKADGAGVLCGGTLLGERFGFTALLNFTAFDPSDITIKKTALPYQREASRSYSVFNISCGPVYGASFDEQTLFTVSLLAELGYGFFSDYYDSNYYGEEAVYSETAVRIGTGLDLGFVLIVTDYLGVRIGITSSLYFYENISWDLSKNGNVTSNGTFKSTENFLSFNIRPAIGIVIKK